MKTFEIAVKRTEKTTTNEHIFISYESRLPEITIKFTIEPTKKAEILLQWQIHERLKIVEPTAATTRNFDV